MEVRRRFLQVAKYKKIKGDIGVIKVIVSEHKLSTLELETRVIEINFRLESNFAIILKIF